VGCPSSSPASTHYTQQVLSLLPRGVVSCAVTVEAWLRRWPLPDVHGIAVFALSVLPRSSPRSPLSRKLVLAPNRPVLPQIVAYIRSSCRPKQGIFRSPVLPRDDEDCFPASSITQRFYLVPVRWCVESLADTTRDCHPDDDRCVCDGS